MMLKLEEVASRLAPHDIAFVGGSRLKGYGTTLSDFDVWNYNDAITDSKLKPGSPDDIRVYYDTIWIYGNALK